MAEETKYSIKAIAAMRGWTYEQLSQATGIKPRRLMALNNGTGIMLVRELYALEKATGVPAEKIAYN